MRTKIIVGLMAVMMALIVVSAAPAMAKGNQNGNGVNEERGETPRQQANEENNFGGFSNGCFNFNCGINNFGLLGFNDFGNNDFEGQNAFINCPVVGVISDNGSTVNNTCNPLVASDL